MIRALLCLSLVLPCFAQDYYSAALDGQQVVPAATGPAAGFAVLRYQPTSGQLRCFAHLEGLQSPVQSAAVRLGASTANGPVLLPLAAAGAGAWTGSKLLNATEAAALASAGLYLDVRTTLLPLGEVRGQIVAARANRFRAALGGSQVVPPVTTTATGQLEAIFYEPERRLVYFLSNAGVGTVLGVDLRRAAIGNNGPLVAALDGQAQNGVDFCGATGRLGAADTAALLGNDCYLQVRTAATPTGELRGQLERDIGPFVGALSGAQVVPATPSTAAGGVQVTVRPDGAVRIDGSFTTLVGAPTAVEVRQAPPLSNGPLVFTVPLAGASFTGTHTPTQPQLNDLLAGNWYVTVASSTYRQGELRGQLLVGARPTTFGRGCVGAHGRRPKIGARQGAVIGAPFSMDLFAAGSGQIALLGFGAERDQFAALPLPLMAASVGVAAPGCALLLMPQLFEARVTDVAGCARVALDVPVVPSLRGSRHVAQWLVLDGAANPAGLVASDALSLVIE
jgi:hypothetical protein